MGGGGHSNGCVSLYTPNGVFGNGSTRGVNTPQWFPARSGGITINNTVYETSGKHLVYIYEPSDTH